MDSEHHEADEGEVHEAPAPADAHDEEGAGEGMAQAMRAGVEEVLGTERSDPEIEEREPDPGAEPAEARAGEAVTPPAPKPDPGAEPADPDPDAEIEASLKDRARERFRELKGEASVTRQIREAFQESGMQPEQFGAVLGFASKYNSRDPRDNAEAIMVANAHAGELVQRLADGGHTEQLRQVAAQLAEQQRYLALIVGDAPGADAAAPPSYSTLAALEAYPELIEQVQNHDLPVDRALEIARYREAARRTQARQQVEQQHHETLAQGQQVNSRVIAASEQIQALEADWRARDLDFDRKREDLEQRVELIVRAYRETPEVWPQMIAEAYATISRRHALPDSGRARRPGPLSAGAVQAHGGGEPKSMLEAMRLGAEREFGG